jgi:hypothetical protein
VTTPSLISARVILTMARERLNTSRTDSSPRLRFDHNLTHSPWLAPPNPYSRRKALKISTFGEMNLLGVHVEMSNESPPQQRCLGD